MPRDLPARRRGGPRPNSGPPKGNLNAYKTGRTSKQHQRLLRLIAEDPEALQLLLSIARIQRRRRRQARREANALLQDIAGCIRDRALDDAVAVHENDQTIPPPPNTDRPANAPISRKTTKKPSHFPRTTQPAP